MNVTCVGSDGKSLVAGGRSNLLHLWCLDSKQLVRVIQMPTQVRTVRQLEFLPDSFDGGANQVQSVRLLGSSAEDYNFPRVNLFFSSLSDTGRTEPGWCDALHQHSQLQAAVQRGFP